MKNKIILLSILPSLLLTACYPTGEITPESTPNYVTQQDPRTSSGEDSDNIPEIASPNLKNVKLSLSYPDSPENAAELDTSYFQWDIDNVKNFFLSGKEIAEEFAYESDRTEGEMRRVYDTSDSYRLILDSGYLTFSNRGNPNRDEYTMLESSWLIDDMNAIFGEEELADFPADTAVKQVTDIFTQIGISTYGNFSVYPLHAEDVNRYFADNFSTMQKKDGSLYQVNWQEDDEAYLIVFSQEIGNYQFSNTITYADAIVTRSGITEIDIDNWNQESVIESTSRFVPVTSVDAVNSLIDHYESIIMDSPVEIYSCQFVMYPKSSVGIDPTHYIPAWEFSIKKRRSDSTYYIDTVYIDANSRKLVKRDGQ